jgi:GYF domain 2
MSGDDQWYVSKHGKEYGPIQFSDLAKFAKQKLLLEDDWVWRHGLKQWIAARDVPGLFPTTAQLPDETARTNKIVSEGRGEQEYKRTFKERLLDSAKNIHFDVSISLVGLWSIGSSRINYIDAK